MSNQTVAAEIDTASNTKYNVITDGDAVQVAKSIWEAKVALEQATATYEDRLLSTPVIYGSKATDSSISKASGVSKAMVGIYRRTGRIIGEFKQSPGVTPSMVAAAVNKGFQSPGSFGANVDPILDNLMVSKDEPTWRDALTAINKATGKTGEVKSDAEKVDGYIANIQKAIKKGYTLTDDQRAALASL